MGTKICPVCGEVEIDEKYQMCMGCLRGTKKKNIEVDALAVLKDISENLKHINWNLGKMWLHMKGDTDTIKKIEDDERKEGISQ